jgi:hypothetical protein
MVALNREVLGLFVWEKPRNENHKKAIVNIDLE